MHVLGRVREIVDLEERKADERRLESIA